MDALFMICTSSGFDINIGDDPVKYMIGGKATTINRYPYQISLRLKTTKKHFCGGAIITPKFVLTAAHCIVSTPNSILSYYIFVGSSLLSGPGDEYAIDAGIAHKNYDDINRKDDIGLIVIKKRFHFHKGVQPIKILLQPPPPGKLLRITGWGAKEWPIRGSQDFPNQIEGVEIPIVTLKECKKAFGPLVGPKQICTFSKKRHVGTCKGDSGGPLAYEGMLVAVVSYGFPCSQGEPDVNTKVASYVSWITGQMVNYCKKNTCMAKDKHPTFVKSL